MVEDGFHLNDWVTQILAGNFGDSFNNFILEEYTNFNNKFGLRQMDPENASFNGKQRELLRKTVVYQLRILVLELKMWIN